MINYRKLVSIKAAEAGQVENPQWINILNTGAWQTNYQGSFEVKLEHLDEMVVNFSQGVRKGVPIDTDHDNGASNGWITQLQVRNASELWALVEWTSLGEEKLSSKIYKFLSPEFAPVYNDPETNSFRANNVLIAAALTNFPLMKGLQAVVANEKGLYFNENPEEGKMVKAAVLTTKKEKKLDDSDFAYIDSKGVRKLPIQDKAHVRNALARFEQTDFEDEAAKTKAKKKIESKAKELGVDTKESKKEGDDGYKEAPVKDIKGDKDMMMKKEDMPKKDMKKKMSETVEDDSMESEIDEIHDAFCDMEFNPFKGAYYQIVGTFEDEATGAGHLIVKADPDFDGNCKYYRVDFTEDEEAETYNFEEPVQVEQTFETIKEEMAEGEIKANYKVRTVKADENLHEFEKQALEAEKVAEKPAEVVKVEEKPVEKVEIVAEPIESAPVAPEVKAEPVIKKDTKKANEININPEIMKLKGFPSKVKATDGTALDVVDGEIVEEAKVEPIVEQPTIIAVEGSTETITAAELAEFRQAKESLCAKEAEIEKRNATEKIESLCFNEKNLRLPTQSKDAVVSFYLELNEQKRDEFVGILEKLPAVKMFNEIGDGGTEVSGEAAYDQMSVKANEILAANKGMNYGQALQAARKANPDLAKLANEHKIKVNKG